MVLSMGRPMMGYPWYSDPGIGGESHGDGIARRGGSDGFGLAAGAGLAGDGKRVAGSERVSL
jgi:hypothetical protein